MYSHYNHLPCKQTYTDLISPTKRLSQTLLLPYTENVLQYEADLRVAPVLPYAGPCLLEIKKGEVIVWTRETFEEVIRWKLAHIRSFKAKKNLFTLHAGRCG